MEGGCCDEQHSPRPERGEGLFVTFVPPASHQHQTDASESQGHPQQLGAFERLSQQPPGEQQNEDRGGLVEYRRHRGIGVAIAAQPQQ